MTDSISDTGKSLDQELDEAISGFDQIQTELNYRQAQATLRELVENLDLTAQERSGLESEIHGLETMLEKLDRLVVQIAAFGMVGRGKSSLLNALLGQQIFETGAIHGVTRSQQSANWSIESEAIAGSDQEILRVTLPSVNRSQIELIDTPGIDEVQGEAREALARQAAQQADLLLFIVSGDITKVEFQALSELRNFGKPMILVFNKIDQYPDADRMSIYQKIRDERVKELLSPDEIVMAAASPMVARAVKRPDGRMSAQMIRLDPQVQDLKLKILEVLHREGKSLVALNSMLFADQINDRLLRRKLDIREQTANRTIWNGVMTKAIATAVNPVMVLDLISSAAIDVAMIMSLSKLYGISMTQQGAIKLLQRIAIAMGGITASELLANLGLSSLKSLLGLSAPATGGLSLAPYLSVAVTQGAVAGVSTYAIGQIAKVYLANDASWGAESPKAVVTKILSSLDEDSILNRIKDELRAKLDLSARQPTK
ncbi:MAG: GTP-binding protein [Leptolyngbya sp. UWPOB_LEPTO1]|uniref:GTP-binding protein n=1 Tax=Leptolyngbya sp. UWPOB_LEPTO1 TaxID=2815653 RepID=UPI001ACECF9C|nr:GTP-binding protein [Leptolyngbya sp. UWPOB_LEPTO1]MBN8564277.1 GTP-binding protein [Leptolyngbya sp. UWPOB_LEPTO1]